MEVRMTSQLSGYRGNGERWPAVGGTVELPEDEALTVVRNGDAVPVNQSAKVEKAVAVPAEVRLEDAERTETETVRRGRKTTAATNGERVKDNLEPDGVKGPYVKDVPEVATKDNPRSAPKVSE